MILTNSGEYLFYTPRVLKGKIAGFDLDGTIIKTKSGKKKDWVYAFDNVIQKLQEIKNKGFQIVIISNQKNLKNIPDFEYKLNNVFANIDIDAIFIANKDNYFRKPYPGFYKFVSLDFYVGDAAGRPGDHSYTDAAFAVNAGVQFFTPEHFFLGEKNYYNLKIPEIHVKQFKIPKIIDKTVIMMVGRPGSGKSTIAKYIQKKTSGLIFSNDLSKNAFNEYLNALEKHDKIIIIDNTNPSKKTRQQWLEPAYQKGYLTIIIWVDIPDEVSRYLNKYRYYTTGEKRIPDIAFNVYNKKFKEPTEDEGEIIRINYITKKLTNKIFV